MRLYKCLYFHLPFAQHRSQDPDEVGVAHLAVQILSFLSLIPKHTRMFTSISPHYAAKYLVTRHVKLPPHLQLEPKLRTSGTIPPLSPYAFRNPRRYKFRLYYYSLSHRPLVKETSKDLRLLLTALWVGAAVPGSRCADACDRHGPYCDAAELLRRLL